MINVKHPDKACNDAQQQLIDSLPDEEKEKASLMFSYGNASYKYHALDIEPTNEDYKEWLEGLEGAVKKGMTDLGFEKSKGVLSFTRYVREKKDIGMEEFLKNLMGTDYDKYKTLINV